MDSDVGRTRVVHLFGTLISAILHYCQNGLITFAFNPSLGVEVLEYQNIVLALITHIIKPLAVIVLHVHRRARVLASDVISLNEIVRIDTGSITYR